MVDELALDLSKAIDQLFDVSVVRIAPRDIVDLYLINVEAITFGYQLNGILRRRGVVDETEFAELQARIDATNKRNDDWFKRLSAQQKR